MGKPRKLTAVSPAAAAANEATWRDFQRDLVAAGRAERTLAAYRQGFDSLTRATGYRDVLSLAKQDIISWLIGLRDRGLKQSSVNSYYRAVHAFYTWAEKQDDLLDAPSPLRGVEPPQIDRQPMAIPPADDIRKVLEHIAADKSFTGKRDEAMIRIWCEPGAPRASEMAALRVADVDLAGDVVTISRGKGGKTRTFPLSARPAKALSRYLRARARHPLADECPQLFLGHKGAMTRSGMYQMVERRITRAGVSGISPHRFRNYAASSYLAAGGRPGDLMVLMGWESEEMVRRYTGAVAVDLAHAAARQLALGNAL